MTQHVAVLKGRYLKLLLDGSKRIECRLTRTAQVPFNTVHSGQTIWLKRSGGWIEACALAGRVLSRKNLTAGQIDKLKQQYNDLICGQDHFWQSRRDCRYATLIWLEEIRPVPPFKLQNQPRAPWIVLNKKISLQFESKHTQG